MLSFLLKKLREIAADLPKKTKGRKPSILVQVIRSGGGDLDVHV